MYKLCSKQGVEEREKMPSLDDQDRVVGPVLRECESGTYVKTFLVLDFGSHTLYGYAGYAGSPEVCKTHLFRLGL